MRVTPTASHADLTPRIVEAVDDDDHLELRGAAVVMLFPALAFASLSMAVDGVRLLEGGSPSGVVVDGLVAVMLSALMVKLVQGAQRAHATGPTRR